VATRRSGADRPVTCTAPHSVSADARPGRIAALVLVSWVVLNYGWTLSFGLNNDDFIWIHGASAAGARPWTIVDPPVFGRGFLRPLVQASFALQYALHGIQPWGYHLFNVVVHAGTVVLLYDVLRVLLDAEWLALVSAAAFAVHPDGALAVVWVSGRTEVLCGLFYVAALAAYLRDRRAAAVTFFVLALGSKESAVSLPVLLAALVALRPAGHVRPRAQELVRLWPFATVLAGYAVVRFPVLRDYLPVAVDFVSPSHVSAFMRDKITMMGQFLLSPLPVHGFVRSLLLLTGLPAAALWGTRNSPAPYAPGVRIGLAWAAIALLPFLPWFTFLPWYTYLPSMGVSLALSSAGGDLLRRLRAARARRIATVAAVAAWLAASVAVLQAGNAAERRAGQRTAAVTSALWRAMAPAKPATLFVVSGLERDALGGGLGFEGKPILLYGFTAALRLRAEDQSVDVEYGDRAYAERRATVRPVVFLQWNEADQAFRRVWQSF
jgi:hypothetical protein